MRAPRTALYAVVAGASALLVCSWLRSRNAHSPDAPPPPPRTVVPPEAPPALRGAAHRARAESGMESPSAVADGPAEGTPAAEPEKTYHVRIDFVDTDSGRASRDVKFGYQVPQVMRSAIRIDDGDLGGFDVRFLKPSVPTGFAYYVAKLTGYVTPRETVLPLTPSRYASTLVIVHPLRPEMDARVTVLEADGRLALDAPHVAFDLGGVTEWDALLEPLARGAWRIRGVPFLPGETLRLEARRAPARVETVAAVRGTEEVLDELPVEGLTKPQWTGVEPFDRRARIEATVTLPPPRDGILDQELSDHVETDNDLPVEESLGVGGTDDPPPARTASVTVVAHRRDGRPAADARVLVAGEERRADAEGRARFTDLRPGLCAIRVVEPGVLPARSETTLAAGADATVTLTEPEPGRIDLTVKDSEGRPLPFASIVHVKMASGLPWIDLDGDVQRVDPYVDHLGRRTLSNVEPGDVTVRVRYGARSGEATVRVAAGVGTRTDIVLK